MSVYSNSECTLKIEFSLATDWRLSSENSDELLISSDRKNIKNILVSVAQ